MTLGVVYIVTTAVAWAEQLPPSDPTTVYMVVTVGLAVTVAPVLADNPVFGDQV